MSWTQPTVEARNPSAARLPLASPPPARYCDDLGISQSAETDERHGLGRQQEAYGEQCRLRSELGGGRHRVVDAVDCVCTVSDRRKCERFRQRRLQSGSNAASGVTSDRNASAHRGVRSVRQAGAACPEPGPPGGVRDLARGDEYLLGCLSVGQSPEQSDGPRRREQRPLLVAFAVDATSASSCSRSTNEPRLNRTSACTCAVSKHGRACQAASARRSAVVRRTEWA